MFSVMAIIQSGNNEMIPINKKWRYFKKYLSKDLWVVNGRLSSFPHRSSISSKVIGNYKFW